MININPEFESRPMNLEEETIFTKERLELNLEQFKLQKAQIEEKLAELELKYVGTSYTQEDLDFKTDRETFLIMLNEAIKEAEEKLKKI